MRDRKWLALLGLFLLAAWGTGCTGTKEVSDTEVSGKLPNESETEPSTEAAAESWPGQADSPDTSEFPLPPAKQEEETLGAEDEDFVQQKVVIATDLHYLAEELAGNRGPSFMEMVQESDGRVLQYGWEVLDAFLEDMLEEKPALVVLSGDLTLNGERESHEELAEKLSVLSENGIETAVIPGNHDINNPEAAAYLSDGKERTETISAEEFAEIYADYGYVAADSRDPASLSYLYKLDDYYWLLMLDSCQYTPVNQIGGMIQMETYRWMEEQLEKAWEEGAQVITVSHHNLLDQSGVSREFYDNCTIEHNEELLELLSSYEVRLHFSGHLHVQHYMEDEESGIYEVVNGSLVMAPCQYGILQIWNNGTLQYDAKEVDVSGWAVRNRYKNNKELTEFKTFCEQFLGKVSFQAAVKDLQEQFYSRRLFLSNEDMTEMANFYAALCVYYFGGRMYELREWVREQDAYQMWKQIEYASELSTFLENILEDDAKDFSHLTIPY